MDGLPPHVPQLLEALRHAVPRLANTFSRLRGKVELGVIKFLMDMKQEEGLDETEERQLVALKKRRKALLQQQIERDLQDEGGDD